MQRSYQVTVALLAKDLSMTAPTAWAALRHMVTCGILEESAHKIRDKTYVYRQYLDLLAEGTEPLSRHA